MDTRLNHTTRWAKCRAGDERRRENAASIPPRIRCCIISVHTERTIFKCPKMVEIPSFLFALKAAAQIERKNLICRGERGALSAPGDAWMRAVASGANKGFCVEAGAAIHNSPPRQQQIRSKSQPMIQKFVRIFYFLVQKIIKNRGTEEEKSRRFQGPRQRDLLGIPREKIGAPTTGPIASNTQIDDSRPTTSARNVF
jgi:hypothetical protein